MMTETEARECLNKIRESLTSARVELVRLYDLEGWKALGYDSWRECVTEEFGASASYLYRQLASARLERTLALEPGTHRESHLRPLIDILDNDHDREMAYAIAMSRGDDLSATDFRAAACWLYVQRHAPSAMRRRMETGSLSPINAYSILSTAASSPPELSRVLLECVDIELVPMLRNMYYENTDTWQEIEATMCIPGVEEQIPLSKATAPSLRAWLDISSNEHRAAAIERNRERYDMMKDLVASIIKEARVNPSPKMKELLRRYDDFFKGRND